MSTCPNCDGYGYIVTCCDDICVGGNHCIHGDGEEFCTACDGEGWIDDDEWPEDFDDDGYPDEFDFFDEEQAERDEEEYNRELICKTCGGVIGPEYSTCICEDDYESN